MTYGCPMPMQAPSAQEIIEVVDRGGTALVLLTRYRIGDSYESECAATALTISPEHTQNLRAHEDGSVTCLTFFPPQLVPVSYREQVNENGVVEIPLRFDLSDVYGMEIFS